MAAISESEKPLAMRSIAAAGRCPARKACISVTIAGGGRPTRRATGVGSAALAEWQPEQELAPGGASGATALAGPVRETNTANPMIVRRNTVSAFTAAERSPIGQAELKSWFISGSERIRFPVAAKIALSTAGAAT